MGLTKNSTGSMAIDSGLKIVKENVTDKVIALAGNPNVGKSSVFNELTGLKQHTGNWPGKTVTNAQGQYTYNGTNYILVDIPGTYSLMAHSAEEEVARDFICFGEADTVVVVCDATCLERNLNLVLQTLEITKNVIVCVNLIDEARKKKINIDYKKLELKLGVPVVAVSARNKEGLDILQKTISENKNQSNNDYIIKYDKVIEDAISQLEPIINKNIAKKINSRWLSLKLIEKDESLIKSLNEYLNWEPLKDEEIKTKIEEIEKQINSNGITISNLKDKIISSIVKKAEDICSGVITYGKIDYNKRDRNIDKILTNKWTGIPIMLILLGLIFWITITGANYPSELLSNILFSFESKLTQLFTFLHAPEWLHGILILGGYRVLAWVVSVMLPPMAIFFPLFTLLEDLGYLPRIAFNLDKCLKKCCACGKQALTMCIKKFMLLLFHKKIFAYHYILAYNTQYRKN